MTRDDLVRRIDALLLLDEGRFEASRQIIGDVLSDCREALTRESCGHVLVQRTAAVGKSECLPEIHYCQRQNCPVCKTGAHAE